MDLVSIIIPVHNSEKYLEKCVSSVLNQTYNNIEVILVDDGSTDGSAKICDTYSMDTRVKVFHNSNCGLSAARQFGIDNCNGEYFCTIDSDDYVSPNYISYLFNLIKSNNCDISKCARFDFEDSNPQKIMRVDCIPSKSELTNAEMIEDYMSLVKIYNMGDSWDKMYRTGFVKSSGVVFNLPKGYNGNDLAFNYKLLMHCPNIVSDTEPLLYHRIVTGSIVHKRNSLMQDGFETIVKQIIDEAEKCNIDFNSNIASVYDTLMVLVILNIVLYYSDFKQLKIEIREYLCKYKEFVNENKIRRSASNKKDYFSRLAIKYSDSYSFVKLYILCFIYSKKLRIKK